MKHIAAVIPILICLSFGSADAKVIGDFNDDGQITIADAIAFIMHMMGKTTIQEIGQELGSSSTRDTITVYTVTPLENPEHPLYGIWQIYQAEISGITLDSTKASGTIGFGEISNIFGQWSVPIV